jgi:hypothetical protein
LPLTIVWQGDGGFDVGVDLVKLPFVAKTCQFVPAENQKMFVCGKFIHQALNSAFLGMKSFNLFVELT